MPPGLQYYSPGGMSYVMPNECLGGIFNTSDEACACAGAGGRFCFTRTEVECEIVDVKEAIFLSLFVGFVGMVRTQYIAPGRRYTSRNNGR